jgi:N,N-dimethylformamidase beta subunit-like, C-terminal
MFRRSTDNGATFDSITKLNGISVHSYRPQIAVSDNGNIYSVWEENPQGTNGEIMFRRSTDNGATFDSIINLSNNTGWAVKPQIAVSDNGNIYAAWQNQSTENSEIAFVRISAGNDTSFSYKNNVETEESVVSANANPRTLRIAIVDPVFTKSAYNNSFYVFYNMATHLAGVETDRDIPSDISITRYTNLLSSQVNGEKKAIELDEQLLYLIKHIKWLIPGSNTAILTDIHVDEGALSFQNGTNRYDIVILGHQEYVTQREYDNLKRFVANGGVMILLDGNVFYAEVTYDPEQERITLVKGHRWAFDGNSAQRSVEERWEKETSDWVGSNYLCCYGYKIRFGNNPFDYTHNEEQYITNPDVTVLLDYNATVLEERYQFDPRIATYKLDYNKGMVIALGLYSEDILSNSRFQRFFDSLLLEYGRGIRN